MSNIYFAGGSYPSATDPNKRVFKLVTTSNDNRPYLTHNENGLKTTSHHSNLYCLSNDKTKAICVRRCDAINSAVHTENELELTKEQQSVIQKAIIDHYFFQ